MSFPLKFDVNSYTILIVVIYMVTLTIGCLHLKHKNCYFAKSFFRLELYLSYLY